MNELIIEMIIGLLSGRAGLGLKLKMSGFFGLGKA